MGKCATCGAVNGDSAKFCGLCHSTLVAPTSPKVEPIPVEMTKERHRTALILGITALIIMLALTWSLTRPSVFSAPMGAKAVVFNWEHEKRPYSVELTLHENVDDFYGTQQKGMFRGREEAGLAKYLKTAEGDDTIKELVASIKDLAAQNNLGDEETVELAVAFVQSIPYDFETAGGDGALRPRYAYEVLYDNQGICSEKSYLAYAILREMGYGAAVFIYPDENHMNIGVQAPIEHSTDGTGYSIVETTNRNIKIGMIPNIDPSGQALQTEALQEFNLRNPSTTIGKNLSTPNVYARTEGSEYAGVIERFQASKEVAEVQEILAAQKALIESRSANLERQRALLESYRTKNDASAYNSALNSYNAELADLKDLIDDHNVEVRRYNVLVSEI